MRRGSAYKGLTLHPMCQKCSMKVSYHRASFIIWLLATLPLSPLRASPSSYHYPLSDSLSLGCLSPSSACSWLRNLREMKSDSQTQAADPAPLSHYHQSCQSKTMNIHTWRFNISPKKSFSYMSQTQKAQRIKSRRVTLSWSDFYQQVWRIFLSSFISFFLICVLQQTGSRLTRDCMFIPIIKNIWQVSGNALTCQGNKMHSPTLALEE